MLNIAVINYKNSYNIQALQRKYLCTLILKYSEYDVNHFEQRLLCETSLIVGINYCTYSIYSTELNLLLK
jgi:hypothetical protein